MSIEICPTHLVDSIWPTLRQGFVDACQKGRQPVFRGRAAPDLSDGRSLSRPDDRGQQIIVVPSSLQEQQWANRQVLSVLAVTGGDRTGWWDPMLEWGGQAFPGCRTLVFDGRPGWGRMPGVKVLRHVYEVDLDHGTIQ